MMKHLTKLNQDEFFFFENKKQKMIVKHNMMKHLTNCRSPPQALQAARAREQEKRRRGRGRPTLILKDK